MNITSIPLQVPRSRYSFSDTFGGTTDPTTSPDPDALISQDLQGEPWLQHHREFDILHRQGSVRHLLRLLLSLHDKHLYLRWRHTYTGVLINHQEDGRLEEGANGHEFHVAETDNNVRIIASPVDDLVHLTSRIKALKRLPNHNDLFGSNEQFRSQYVPLLLARDHRYETLLEDASLDVIHPDPQQGVLRVVYVDRFGNLLAWKEGGIEEERERLKERIGKTVGVRFGDDAKPQEMHVSASFPQAKPGTFSVYPHGQNIDFVGKWAKGERVDFRDLYSAYNRAGHPVENVTPVRFAW